MILTREQKDGIKELEVIIRYEKENEEMKQVENLLNSWNHSISCEEERVQRKIPVSEIYYIESVDKHSFVYCREKVYSSKQRLYQLSTELAQDGFVRVSKACIVNIQYVKGIKTLVNSRIEAQLLNGESVVVNRKYIPSIKKYLEERSPV